MNLNLYECFSNLLHYFSFSEDTVGLMMTAADLMVCCKAWPVQRETVQLIYEEFYNQVQKTQNNRPFLNACL